MNNLQKFLLALVIVMLVGIGAGGLLIFQNIGDQLTNTGGSTSPIEETASYPVDGLDELDIHSVSADIELINTEDPEITASLTGNARLGDDNQPAVKLVTGITGNRLDIHVERQVSFDLGNTHLNLKVYVPKEYQGSMQIASTSGDIQMCTFDLENLKATLVSGEFTADRINAKEADISTTSGDVQISSLIGKLACKTVSGNIEAAFPALSQDIDIESVSGNADLALPKDAGFILNAQSTSGNLNCDFPVTINDQAGHNRMNGTVASGTSKINVKTVSGYIHIAQQ